MITGNPSFLTIPVNLIEIDKASKIVMVVRIANRTGFCEGSLAGRHVLTCPEGYLPPIPREILKPRCSCRCRVLVCSPWDLELSALIELRVPYRTLVRSTRSLQLYTFSRAAAFILFLVLPPLPRAAIKVYLHVFIPYP